MLNWIYRFKWVRESERRGLIRWIPVWERIRARGRSRYIWLRVMPAHLLWGVMFYCLAFVWVPIACHHHPIHSHRWILLGLAPLVCLGHHNGIKLWDRLETRYAIAKRILDAGTHK